MVDMSSNISLFSAGARESSNAHLDLASTPINDPFPSYLRNDLQVSASHATHPLLYDHANLGHQVQRSDHFDHLTSLAVLHNELLLQRSSACVDDHSGSDLSSEAAFAAGARSLMLNAGGMLPSQAEQYNSSGLLAILKGAAVMRRGNNMNIHEGRKAIDHLSYVGLDVERVGSSNGHNLCEQKQQVQRGFELPYNLAEIRGGDSGETMHTRSHELSAEYQRGNLGVSQEVERMSSITRGNNMMSRKLYEVEGGQPESTLAYQTTRYGSMSNNEEVMGDVQKSYSTLTPNQFDDHQAATRREWDNIENLAAIASAEATKELLMLNREQASTMIPRNNILSSMYSTASNYNGACDAAASVGVYGMSPNQLLHRSSLHDHSPLNVASTVHGGQPPGRPQFDIACTKPGLPLAHWDNHTNMNSRNAIAATSCRLKQERPVNTASRSTFLNYLGDVHQEMSSPDGGLSLHLQSGIPHSQHSILRRSSDLFSLDFSYSCAGSGGVLRSSKYLKAAQQLLKEVSNVIKPHSTRAPERSTSSHSAEDRPGDAPPVPKQQLTAEERCNLQMRKSQLIGMVEELDRKYQQYREQMQLVVTSYESATGMGAAAPYTAVARRTVSMKFRALRNTIAEHIQAACRSLGEDISSVPILNKGETPRLRILDQRMHHLRTLQQVGMLPHQHQAWRPQRGLPERSVAVLRAWLFEHFLHPYPKDSEKLMLARLTGLTRNQVANWFINARVRLWKPMVEQMYTEEWKEAESQDEAPAAQDEGRSNTTYTSSRGNSTVMTQAMHVEHASDGYEGCPKPHHYQNLVHGDSNSACTLHPSMMTKDGVSLTLALPQSSSVELAQNTYNSNHYYHVQQACAEANYNITDAFS
eukprot:c25095_g2_i1 orf=299-2908(+)